MLKRLLIAGLFLVVVAVAAALIGLNLFTGKMMQGIFANMKAPPVTVSVVEVAASDWQPGLEAIGTAAAVQGTDLAIEASGIVREIRFAANDKVKKGQLLVQIDDRTERADLEAARAAAALAETALQRARELSQRGVSASSALDEAEAAAIETRATVQKLEASLSTKELTAPFDGTVGIPQIEVGSYVSAGTTFATLQDRSHMRVDFTLTEADAALVTPGMALTVQSEVGDVTAEGRIVGIEPKIDPNSRLVTIRADVPNEGETLTPGQFLRVRVLLPMEKGVIALPQTVLSSSLYGDSVFALREETPEGAEAPELHARQVFVKVGRNFGDKVEVVSGLVEGDRVVSAGQNKLTSGALVVVDNSQSLDASKPAAAGN